MPTEILVPPLSQTMDSVVLVEWTKKVGEPVNKGETLFLVETDKATLEVEAPASGVLYETFAQPGNDVKVRSRIGTILAPGEAVPGHAHGQVTAGGEKTFADSVSAPPGTVSPEQLQGPAVSRQGRIFASPRARRVAASNGIDIPKAEGEIAPSGPHGMIVSRDVLTYLDARQKQARMTPLARRVAEDLGVDVAALAKSHPGAVITRADVEDLRKKEDVNAGDQAVVLSSLRRTIARRMQESHQTTAPVTLTREVDVTRLKALRELLLSTLPIEAARPTYTDFVAFIVTRCLTRHPELNGVAVGDSWELGGEVHLALAVDTARGLLTPVIRSAQTKGLLDLATERRALTERARNGSSTAEELKGGTFTVTNLGTLGVDAFTPIINPPQIAILGIGRIRTVVAWGAGQVVPRDAMYLSLTFDHRIVDGAPAARLLDDISRWTEEPELIWLH